MANQALMAAMHVAAGILVILDFLVWVLTLGPLWMALKKMKIPDAWASVAGVANINGELDPSGVFRSLHAVEKGKLSDSPFPGEVTTIWQLLERAYRLYGARPAQGIRPLLRMQEDKGFRFPAKVFGETQWRTYAELGSMAKAFGAGLRALGMEPQPEGNFDELEGKFKIMMYEDTCADWALCMHGAVSQAMVVATCYATLGVPSVISSVLEGKVTVLVCNLKAVAMLLKKASEMPSLEAIVYLDNGCMPEEIKDLKAKLKAEPAGSVKVLSLEEVIELGKEKPVPPTQPKPEHVAVLMYTSGSTGKPKGVMVRHSQLLATVAAVKDQFCEILDMSGETYLGYLPLAHILELTAETYFLGMGNRIGYADPKTLMSGPEKCYPTGGLEEFKPTLMAGVPKVWETIKKGAEAKLAKASPASQFLFKVALRVKKAAMKGSRYTPIFDLLVFGRFKSMIGGKMKFTLSGGGAISSEVQEWVRTCFGCPLVQGYGLTETCGASCIQHPFDVSVGVAGSPLSSVEFTLHSEPDITDSKKKPYLATDKEHANGQPCLGRGEVWIRGPGVTSGYFKQPEKTAEDFDKDGWFHTGDIGMFTPEGHLKIVDRKKNLVKLKGGEYVALEHMNATYNLADIVNAEAGGVCSYADGELDKPLVLVQCKVKELTALAEEAGVTGKEGEALCHDPKVMAAVKAKLDAVAKADKSFPALFNAAATMPVVTPWSAENGCLTATNKLVQKQVWEVHAEDIKIMKKMTIK
uniref:AMP-dependent synthetase/ligase domain-containing protein n=1 Tax=Alexandrium monilatum TaxID=311494 RepID=A0A7S4VNU1_9DINO|mmetsp:Transcript_25326/g.75605  ORF Transcript_25326/g.75605 Transcript_25326/m.75605 type:complete len:751 (-) Transcript_25326:85-2337(-)